MRRQLLVLLAAIPLAVGVLFGYLIAYTGSMPDLAALGCVDETRRCALAVLDLETNRSWTVADGWLDLFPGGTPVWSPDGRWVFFQLNDGRLAVYGPGDAEAQIVDVPALDPAIGFAVMSVPDGPISEP